MCYIFWFSVNAWLCLSREEIVNTIYEAQTLADPEDGKGGTDSALARLPLDQPVTTDD